MWVPQDVNAVETGAVEEAAGPTNSTGGPRGAAGSVAAASPAWNTS